MAEPTPPQEAQDPSTSPPPPTPASAPFEKQTPEQQEATRLSTLRKLAQQYLTDIAREDVEEQLQERKRLGDFEKEAMRKGPQRSAKAKVQTSAGEEVPIAQEKGPRMRTAQEVLDRLRWDHSLNISEHRVGYLDRFGGVQELPVSLWIRESTDEEWIPQHRIRYFKRVRVDDGDEVADGEEEIVWHRDERIDKVFGST